MLYSTLLRANLKRHKGSLLGVFALVLIVCLSLSTVLSLWTNSGRYVRGELERLGYGDLTVWVSGVPDLAALEDELNALPEVSRTGIQPLIFSDYELNGQGSDSQAQLIAYAPEQYPYKFFHDTLSAYVEAPNQIEPGQIYVPASLSSMFGAQPGDTITFPIARNGGQVSFTIAGWFEDPFMGSSMIGMKGFLICQADRSMLAQRIQSSGIDALAGNGAMLHIFRQDRRQSMSQWGEVLNAATSLPAYTAFSHSADTIAGFMLILQNVFAGLLLAFVAVLLAVALLVLGHSIRSGLQRDSVNMGILKTLGFTTFMLRQLQLLQYLAAVLGGMLCGLLASLVLIPAVDRMTLTTTGILVPSGLPIGLCMLAFGAILLVLVGFIALQTARIGRIKPLRAILGGKQAQVGQVGGPRIRRRGLTFWLALRQLVTGKRRYLGSCMVALLLVFFSCLVGRINAWLGPNGQGLMDAFNPADHDLGVQVFGSLTAQEAERLITSHTPITDRYLLAMPSVSINGVDYTANVIDEPERFHILQGRTIGSADEIVLTQFLAEDLGVEPGDAVSLSSGGVMAEYTVSGIYQCANDMGANLGMSRAGYERLGQVQPALWCTHYFLEDAGKKTAVMQALEQAYGGDIYVHENTWPGLHGILNAMRLLMAVMYGVIALVILVAVTMTVSRLLAMERRDLGIYRALGFSLPRLRQAFALRFGLVALAGAALGVLLSSLLTDPLVAMLMRLCGISSFTSMPSAGSVLLPAMSVIALFMLFAWLSSRAIGTFDLPALLAE